MLKTNHTTAILHPMVLMAGLMFAVEACAPESAGPGGSGGGTDGGGSGGTSGCNAPEIIKAGCQGRQCHDHDQALDLVSGDLESRLIGKIAIFPPCHTQTLVNSTLPPSGVLLKRLEGHECERQMPPPDSPNPPLPSNAIECVKSWLTAKLTR